MNGIKILLIISFFLIDLGQSVFACRCIEPSAKEAYKNAWSVIRAKTVKIIPIIKGDGGTAILEVSQTWKQDIPKIIAVNTVTSCAYLWQEEQEYIFYLLRESTGFLFTGKCMGNQKMVEAESLLSWLNNNGQSKQVLQTK